MKNVHLYLKDEERKVLLQVVQDEIAEAQDMWSDAASARQEGERRRIQKHLKWLFELEAKLEDDNEEASALEEVES